MPKNRKKNMPRPAAEEPYIKDFLDMVAPSVIDFKVDHYLCGNTCRCVWALREYPTSTDEQAILRHLGEMDGVTIRIYTRQVTPSEERRIIHNAANKHRMSRSSTEDLQQTVTAEANLQDVVTLVSSMHRNREPLLHCAVFLELTAPDYDALKLLQTDVLTELVRSKLNVDRLMLRQQEGFVSVMPAGRNTFGAQFERVLPASSVANLYPFNYSGKTDPHGFYIGKDKYGANNLGMSDNEIWEMGLNMRTSCIEIRGKDFAGWYITPQIKSVADVAKMLSGITTNMDENALGLTVIEAYLGEKRRSITEKEFEVRTNQFFDSDGVGILAKLNFTDDQCVVFTRTLQGGDIIMSGGMISRLAGLYEQAQDHATGRIDQDLFTSGLYQHFGLYKMEPLDEPMEQIEGMTMQ